MPGLVKGIAALLWLQVAFFGLAGFMYAGELWSRVDHGQSLSSSSAIGDWFVSLFYLGLFAWALPVVIKVHRRRGRGAAMGLEWTAAGLFGLSTLGTLAAVLFGGVEPVFALAPLLALAVPVVCLVLLFKQTNREWTHEWFTG